MMRQFVGRFRAGLRGKWAGIAVLGCVPAALVSSGCGAVYPELSSPVRAVPEGKAIEPPAPKSLRYIAFQSAQIPERTRDGRSWDRYGGSAPDPFAKLLVNGKELILTPVQANTLTPTWPDQKRANYELPAGAELTVELWDSNPIHHHPICLKSINDLDEQVIQDTLSLECASGAQIRLTVAPARAKQGLGLYYELRTSAVAVTRVIKHSPAAWAGIRVGDQIISIQGRLVKNMEDGEAQSLINAHARTGLQLQVQPPNGALRKLVLKEGAMYPTIEEGLRF
jgi:hypothetical protein